MSTDNILPASRMFTNRENHFVTFEKAILEIPERPYQILNFYGVGGIGKTRLKEELYASAKTNKELVISKNLNFHNPEYRNPATALHLLADELKAKGVKFPAFEIAYAAYWQKIHPEQKLSKNTLPFIEEGGLAFDLFSLAEGMPIIGIIPKLFITSYNAKKGWNKWWTKIEHELMALDKMEPYQILDGLPYYFALDLKEFMAETSKKPVFFIDTYESLWANQDERKIEKFFGRDKWVRRLIDYLPHTLWIVLGRERLRWDELDD